MEEEIKNRNKEELEQYELDSLRMVGTMENGENQWGIIMGPDGAVHRIKVGNYMGRNTGKVLNVFEDRIELREIVKNSEGRWEERQATIALVEQE
jgi:type IV pilus assembly protein PilP